MSYTYPEMRTETPYCRVAHSNLEDILTFGDKYDASILKSDPIEPSMAHPK
jgi:hypothetical protein